ncbi:hypothetical protein MMC25_001845 [Agyrium rufum]|nr:hypothetical protein [Agyrium rufum]
MNGDNFYARQTSVKADEPPPLSQQPTAPMVNGAPGADKLPAFATYESAKPRRASEEDDQIPLNDRSPSSRNGTLPSNSEDGMERYGPVGSRGGPMGMRGGARGARPYNGGLDEYGNPLPPSGAFGVVPPPARGDPRLRHQNSNETMNSQASRGSRGRGGYPQRGYGRGAQYGPPGRGGPYNGRGGGAFGPPRGGVGGPGGNGGRGGIPLGAMAAGAGAGVLAGEAMGRGQRGPPPGYGNGYPPNGPNDGVPYNGAYGAPSGPQNRRPSPGPPSAPGYGTRQRSPGAPPNPGYGFGGREPSPGAQGRQNFARNSPPPPMPLNDSQDDSTIGQAVEMDALNGSPAQTPGLPPPNNPLRESDSDIAGMVGLQQQRMASPPRHNESPISPSSVYSGPPDSYIPPRTAWGPNALPRLHTPPFATSTGPRSPLRNSPTTRSPVNRSPTGPQPGPMSHQRVNSGDMYYEDMDPRFADRSLEPQIPHQTVPQPAIPSLLVPGRAASNDPYNRRPIQQQPPRAHEPGHLNVVEPSSSYDSINNGDDSDSQFTSISQRGVNPEWRPPPQHSSNGYGGRIEGQRRPDFLAGNPDFEVPGNGQGGGAPRYIGTGGSPRVGKDMGYQPGNAM